MAARELGVTWLTSDGSHSTPLHGRGAALHRTSLFVVGLIPRQLAAALNGLRCYLYFVCGCNVGSELFANRLHGFLNDFAHQPCKQVDFLPIWTIRLGSPR